MFAGPCCLLLRVLSGDNVTLVYVLTNTGNIQLRNATVIVAGVGVLNCSAASELLHVDDQVQCRWAGAKTQAQAIMQGTWLMSCMLLLLPPPLCHHCLCLRRPHLQWHSQPDPGAV